MSSMLQSDTLVDQYFQEIENSVGLSAKEEVAIAEKIKDGDEEALTQLVQANLRFVVSVAKGYQNLGLPLSDLINEGNLGLMVAAKRFDGSKGFKFISYAVWHLLFSPILFFRQLNEFPDADVHNGRGVREAVEHA